MCLYQCAIAFNGWSSGGSERRWASFPVCLYRCAIAFNGWSSDGSEMRTSFYWFFAMSGPFTSFLVLHTVSWFSRSEVCAFVWGIFVRGLHVETFVRVLRSSSVVL